jgi:hypothetical protein
VVLDDLFDIVSHAAELALLHVLPAPLIDSATACEARPVSPSLGRFFAQGASPFFYFMAGGTRQIVGLLADRGDTVARPCQCGKKQSPMQARWLMSALEKLDLALVLHCRLTRLERAEVSAFTRL